LVGYALPYISPKYASSLAVLSLTVPVLIIVNIIFVIYWAIGLKRQFLLSLVCLVFGYFASTPMYIFSSKKNSANNKISIMNYNVRVFNAYKWIENKDIPTKIASFIKTENPDILCIQEFHTSSTINYPYRYIKTVKNSKHFGQAIYSKYNIINKGSLDFKNTSNNAIFIDIVKGLDTIRIYNLHLESLGLNVNKENLGQKSSEKLLKRLSKEFKKQQKQVEQILKHKNNCKYPVIISGDFNNTAYSWTYHKLIHNMKDSYIESGKGFGKTFELKKIPLRIDFIFADKAFIFTEHKNYTNSYSDHEPIMAIVGI
jgi:endonuclease/exonuclease/phosphatase family metal-dependent hydrolase